MSTGQLGKAKPVLSLSESLLNSMAAVMGHAFSYEACDIRADRPPDGGSLSRGENWTLRGELSAGKGSLPVSGLPRG